MISALIGRITEPVIRNRITNVVTTTIASIVGMWPARLSLRSTKNAASPVTRRGYEVSRSRMSDTTFSLAREWSGGEGAEVVFDATGAPDAIRAGFETAVSAGRLVMVGMSHHDVPLRVFGFVDKELDVLGVSCCKGDEFEEAVGFVERNGDKLENLITQEFPLERAPDALRWAMEHPAEAMKVVIGDIN